ncbi:tyrosine-type recombinase/integrase [Pseudemcibacter aquimaris]|uniref:tyrosine-type recombinase/integrase n=1 Tax=Pseudemcibacter aquimaris TaxID=2857064 RepID=UPI002011C2A7|nr:tyrosine-type recombinase/integrase [Pseudemcibacter aquimaris]MCC3862525.1 tyrosine-type recombinase/integrase [Pseudemcibacter aquimaris]WDU57787.1 tyrosine-type recombinase/integrase [Pseudemcibacter aquimaris]
MPKLTKTYVERAQPKDKPYFLFDDSLSGFCLRITPNGKKTYYVQYMVNKKIKRVIIGRHGIFTTERARNQAIVLLGEIKAGADPQKEKSQRRQELYVTQLAERYMEEHVTPHCKPSTRDGYRRYLDKHILPFFGDMKIRDVQRSDVAEFHHSLRHIPYEANRCLEVISKMFNLAEMWGLRDDHTNPRRHIKKYPSKARERYLSEAEVKRLSAVLDEVKRYPDENLAAAYCIQLLLLTGCRLGEIRSLKWDYVDRKLQVLKLPDSKTGAKYVYVGNTVFNLLDEIYDHPARPADNPYVIWGLNEGCHLDNVQKPWRRFRKMAGIEDVRIHDLRHSFASFAVSKGMSLAMIGRLLGHTQVQTTARYAHLMAAPMTEAASQVTDVLGELMNLDTEMKKQKPRRSKPKGVIAGTNIKAPTFLSSDQAAKYLNVAPRLMENWRWRKVGPKYVKVGNRVRYELNDLKSFISNN